jgi:hypothetical protein
VDFYKIRVKETKGIPQVYPDWEVGKRVDDLMERGEDGRMGRASWCPIFPRGTRQDRVVHRLYCLGRLEVDSEVLRFLWASGFWEVDDHRNHRENVQRVRGCLRGKGAHE